MKHFYQVCLLSFVMVLCATQANSTSTVSINKPNQYMYPGEQMLVANGYPSLVRFIEAKKGNGNPLVVFIPGGYHLGRIAYGYPGCNVKDFLAYWLNENNYNFLSISYPLQNPVYDSVYPNYSITDWGRQITSIIKYIAEKHQLSNRVIIISWSMGGRVVNEVNQQLNKANFVLDGYFSFSSTPPIPGLLKTNEYKVELADSGLANQSIFLPAFERMLNIQNRLNKHVIIPNSVYKNQFVGNPPVGITGSGYIYKNGKLQKDMSFILKDSGTFLFKDYPLVSVIHDDSVSDPEHALLDQSYWGMINSQVLYRNIILPSLQSGKVFSPAEWEYLRFIFYHINDLLVRRIHGSHFFFVGEYGARQTVILMKELLLSRKSVMNQLKHVIGQ